METRESHLINRVDIELCDTDRSEKNKERYDKNKELEAELKEMIIKKEPKEQRNIYMALFFQILCTISFACMNMSCKYVFRTNPNLNSFDYVFLRSVSNVALCALQACHYRVNVFDIKSNFKWKV